MEPLFDFQGRTVCLTSRAPLEYVVDSLLRMHSAPNWREPITFYLGLPSANQQRLSAMAALQLSDIIRSLRSPVHTIDLGLLQNYEILVFASGAKGKRFLLPSALLQVGPLVASDLPFPSGGIGWAGPQNGASLREEANKIVSARLLRLAEELGINPQTWKREQLLSACLAIQMGLGDQIVPVLAHSPEKLEQPNEPSLTPNPTVI